MNSINEVFQLRTALHKSSGNSAWVAISFVVGLVLSACATVAPDPRGANKWQNSMVKTQAQYQADFSFCLQRGDRAIANEPSEIDATHFNEHIIRREMKELKSSMAINACMHRFGYSRNPFYQGA